MSSTGALILVGVAFGAFGGFIFWRESRRGNRGQALGAALGIPGAYICWCAVLERVGWFYVPGLVLLGASYAVQLLYMRRARRTPMERRNRSGRDGNE